MISVTNESCKPNRERANERASERERERETERERERDRSYTFFQVSRVKSVAMSSAMLGWEQINIEQ